MFGSTNCPKCENSAFKLQEMNVQGANYKLFAVQCVSCMTPVGIMEYYDTGSLLKGQEKQIASLHQKIDQMNYNLSSLANAVQSLRR
jgi:predicted nucleic-acid-binding Zn-ribbon protein